MNPTQTPGPTLTLSKFYKLSQQRSLHYAGRSLFAYFLLSSKETNGLLLFSPQKHLEKHDLMQLALRSRGKRCPGLHAPPTNPPALYGCFRCQQ
jgi:hypothetical protein